MNKIEFWAMNNPWRAYIQEKIEVKKLRELSALSPGKIVLEIGCGNGTGTKLIKKYFLPAEIKAIDLDEKMIERAKKNYGAIADFSVGDAAQLEFADSSFDAVFDFGIIHHIPNWQDCVKELFRVLKPGGELILEDLSIETFSHSVGKLVKPLLRHPYKQMFTQVEFIATIKQAGFEIKQQHSLFPLRLFKYFVVIAVKKYKNKEKQESGGII